MSTTSTIAAGCLTTFGSLRANRSFLALEMPPVDFAADLLPIRSSHRRRGPGVETFEEEGIDVLTPCLLFLDVADDGSQVFAHRTESPAGCLLFDEGLHRLGQGDVQGGHGGSSLLSPYHLRRFSAKN